MSLDKRARRLIIILIVFILAALPSYYFYNKYQKAQALLQNPNQASTAEAQVIVTNVGKLIELPTNENPTVATVSDTSKLLDQPFFAKAKNGDKVLIYSNAKKAILYRPSINKIIEVAPVNVGSSTPAPVFQAQSPNPSVSPTASPTPAFIPTSVPSPTAIPAQ
jgi:hypothetical protein